MNKYWMTKIVANWGKFFTLIKETVLIGIFVFPYSSVPKPSELFHPLIPFCWAKRLIWNILHRQRATQIAFLM